MDLVRTVNPQLFRLFRVPLVRFTPDDAESPKAPEERNLLLKLLNVLPPPYSTILTLTSKEIEALSPENIGGLRLNRGELERDLSGRDGLIDTMRFESQPIYVPYLWILIFKEWSRTLLATEGEHSFEELEVTEADRLLFPELENKKKVILHIRPDGTVAEVDESAKTGFNCC